MPRRRNFRRRRAFRRTRRKRTTTRRRTRRRNRPNSTIVRMPTIMPDRMFVKLKVVSNLRYQAVGSVFQRINTNGLFIPIKDETAQPMGLDQWAAFYSFYKVHFCMCRATILNRTAINHIDVVFVWTPSTSDIETFINATTWAEQRYSARFLIQSQNSGASRVRSYKKGMSISKVQGEKLTDQEYDSAFSSNPAKTSFLYIFMNNSINDITASIDVEINLSLTFYCVFWQAVNLTFSIQ